MDLSEKAKQLADELIKQATEIECSQVECAQLLDDIAERVQNAADAAAAGAEWDSTPDVTFRSHQREIMGTLASLAVATKRGELTSLAYVAVCSSGKPAIRSGWHLAEPMELVVGALRVVESRMLAEHEMEYEDDDDDEAEEEPDPHAVN